MEREALGPQNAIWEDGEWVSWRSINSHLEKLELQAQYPNADINLVPLFQELLEIAQRYHFASGKHLNIYGDIGELYGAIMYGIKLHKNYAKGSDGRLGNDFVEVKTITPFKKSQSVTVRLDRHFSQLLIVKINEDHEVSGKLVNRSKLQKAGRKVLRIDWDDVDQI